MCARNICLYRIKCAGILLAEMLVGVKKEEGQERLGEPSDCDARLILNETKETFGWTHLRLLCSLKRVQPRHSGVLPTKPAS